jgi:uncharacterized protein YbjT (DUF2867 family)
MSNLVLVCGATGQVGSVAARTLKRRAIPVRALVRQGTDASALTGAGIDVAIGDLRDRASVEAALDGVSTVVCAVTALSRHMGGEHRMRIRDVDRAGISLLIDAAEAAGIGRCVIVSAGRRFRTAPCALIEASKEVDARLARSRMRTVIVRSEPFAELWFSRNVGFEPAHGRVRIFGEGQNPIRFTSTDDVGTAVAVLAAADDPPAEVELAGPEAMSIREAVGIAESFVGPIRRQHVPRGALWLGSRALRRLRPELASAMALGLALDTSTSDVGPERYRELGIEPRSATESLRRLLATSLSPSGATPTGHVLSRDRETPDS